MLYVQPAIKCFETFEWTDSMKTELLSNVASFQIDLHEAPEGYAKLRLILNNQAYPKVYKYSKLRLPDMINRALIEQNGCQYLRNDCRLICAVEYGGVGVKREGFLSNEYKFDNRSGPAQPIRVTLPFDQMYLDMDFVPALPCCYPTLLDDWCRRNRTHMWPSKKEINAVKTAEVLVVPAGESGRDDILNWRISFTIAEKLLVHSFNDTQIKVYAALKMLTKHHLKPVCPAITSYVVKNILFWVYESSPGTFAEDDFIELLFKALGFLTDGVNRENLENYMIPSRNMLKNRITRTEKTDLLKCIDTMIQEGPKVLLRSPLVKEVYDLLEDDNALQTRWIFRELVDQMLLSIHALQPTDYDRIEHLLHQAQTRQELMTILAVHVLPITKKSNPFGYFDRLISMEIEEVVSRINEGMEGGHVLWLGYSKALGSSS